VKRTRDEVVSNTTISASSPRTMAARIGEEKYAIPRYTAETK